MTREWAATNTLRESLDFLGSCIRSGEGLTETVLAQEIDADAALALVETALDAADDLESRIVDGPGWNAGEVFNSAGRLAAALRAVREGK